MSETSLCVAGSLCPGHLSHQFRLRQISKPQYMCDSTDDCASVCDWINVLFQLPAFYRAIHKCAKEAFILHLYYITELTETLCFTGYLSAATCAATTVSNQLFVRRNRNGTFLAPITAALPQRFKCIHAQEKPITETKWGSSFWCLHIRS